MNGSQTYHWRRSPRAKSLQVKITPWQGVEIVIPRHVSRERARAFVLRHRQWIHDTWKRMHEQIVDADLSLPESLELRGIDEHWAVRYRSRSGSHARVTAGAGRTLTVHYDGRDERAARDALRRWLTEKAREYFSVYASRLSAETGFRYKRLQIRGQTSRWGSCSSNKTLSLNYKLLFLEPELVRYLLIHELAHTRCLDHSARFWRLVTDFEPNGRVLDEELGECWRDVPAWVEMP
ncbi:MAG TPA: SprT family zinc-dependent metalloprotease [Gammaproteobacteria bacterium]|nr:SprT family zinc-dependent metalloprotease [Gammaproteobacteria bacterium]